jgi:hypothetical protein
MRAEPRATTHRGDPMKRLTTITLAVLALAAIPAQGADAARTSINMTKQSSLNMTKQSSYNMTRQSINMTRR